MKLYRQVKASERLPEKKGDYFVLDGLDDRYTDSWNGTEWQHSFYNEVIFWLEEIEITEGEIIDMNPFDTMLCPLSFDAWNLGAKAILKLLEDKK